MWEWWWPVLVGYIAFIRPPPTSTPPSLVIDSLSFGAEANTDCWITRYIWLCLFQLFMACLCNLQAAQILNEIDTERLFSNLPEIYVANRQFWAEHVFPMLKNARSARAPLDPTSLRDGFLKVKYGPLLIHSLSCTVAAKHFSKWLWLTNRFWQFDELFHPYTKYCLDQSQCQQYCKEKDHDNELFKAYLAVRCI